MSDFKLHCLICGAEIKGAAGARGSTKGLCSNCSKSNKAWQKLAQMSIGQEDQ